MASWVSQKKAVLALLDVVGLAAMPVTDHRKTARHRLQYHATESLYMRACAVIEHIQRRQELFGGKLPFR